LNTSGSALVYSTFLVGTRHYGSFVESQAIAVDLRGDAYITGFEGGETFPTTPDAYETYNPNGAAPPGFLTEFNASGSGLVYSTLIANIAGAVGNGVAVDQSGNAYVTGRQNVSTGTNAFDAFAMKLNGNNHGLVYFEMLGGENRDEGRDIVADAQGNAYLTGWTASTDFPTVDPLQPTLNSPAGRTFIAKVSPSGILLKSTYWGGSSQELGNAIALDSQGEVIVVGEGSSPDFPKVNPLPDSSPIYTTVFLVVLDADLSWVRLSSYIPPQTYYLWSGRPSVAVDGDGKVYITGGGVTTSTTSQLLWVDKIDLSLPVVPPPTFDLPEELLNTVAGGTGGDPESSGFSEGGVRYFDGAVRLLSTDLSSSGSGFPWGQTRSWTNLAALSGPSTNGWGVVDLQLPYLLQEDANNTLLVVTSGTNGRYFDLSNGVYKERYFLSDTLTYNSDAGEFVLTDSSGNQLRFYDFSINRPVGQRGQFKSFTDPAGNVTQVTSVNANGTPAEVQLPNGDSYRYTYIPSGPNMGFLQQVTLNRAGTGIVRQVQYSYYGGSWYNPEPNGNPGDLKTVKIMDADGHVLDTSYYRYYQPGEANGYTGGLKYVFNAASYARLVASFGPDPTTLTAAQVAPYADYFFQYDQQWRVIREDVHGAGPSTAEGVGTFLYSYVKSANPEGFNSWRVKTTETLPDLNENIVFTNGYGEPMLNVFHDQTSGQEWDTFYKYDSQGRLVVVANPSAVSGYDENQPDLLNNQSGNYQYLLDNAGLITHMDFYGTTSATETAAGGVAGYLQDIQIQRGELGTPVPQSTMQYFLHAVNSLKVAPVASSTVYRNADGTGAEVTTDAYTWFPNTVQAQSLTVTAPIITASQNGPGTPDVDTTVFDTYGRRIWHQNADGFLDYTAYDPATGAVVKSITDVNADNTDDFTNLPAGWTTPSGGGLHLITTMQVDALGRTTSVTSPEGRVDYTVYDDVDHEVRTYPGWDGAAGRPTAPIQVVREDRAQGYVETLTTAALPNLTGGYPDGTELIADLQSLSRDYTNDAGQVVASDAYFNLDGLTYSPAPDLGSEGTNYYRTRTDFDARGRPFWVQQPTGTIERTDFDSLGRVAATWVGTEDGLLSNMVQVSANVYDNGGIGDGNLTETTAYPGRGAAPRVTDTFFDWRDRPVAEEDGVQANPDPSVHPPVFYNVLDNLDEVTQQLQYDGTDTTITMGSDGVPEKPSSQILLEADTSFDEQGRVYRSALVHKGTTIFFQWDFELTTNYWRDHGGEVIKTAEPGGLVTKEAYDGAGRETVRYLTDGGGDASWADAGNVDGDMVLSQAEAQYDRDGNTLVTIDRERFHNATATGSLGTPTSGVPARVSYAGAYYDNCPTDGN
jgi:hypothetical protein